MFVHQCSSCQRRQLVFPSQFTAFTTVGGGLSATFTCWCGAEETSTVSSLFDDEIPVAA